MAEFSNNELQLVAVGQNVVFDETPVCPTKCIEHRQGSGIVRLKGATNQCRARYLVTFSANIAIPVGGVVAPISLAISVDGEPLQSATMIVTPTVVGAFFNVSSSVFVDVPCGCCVTVAVENTSTQPINVANANLIVTREA